MEFEKLQKIIAEVLSIDASDVKKEMAFVDDLGADSLELYQIAMGIEEVFDVILPEEKIDSIQTVEQALQAVREAQEYEKSH